MYGNHLSRKTPKDSKRKKNQKIKKSKLATESSKKSPKKKSKFDHGNDDAAATTAVF